MQETVVEGPFSKCGEAQVHVKENMEKCFHCPVLIVWLKPEPCERLLGPPKNPDGAL